MKKNKLILFDWGNIVESHQTGYTVYDAYNDIFSNLGYPGKDIWSILGRYHISEIKELSEFKNMFYKLKEELNLEGDFDNFYKIYSYYCDKIDYYQDVRDYEISLKDECYIGIFSNLCILDKERLDKQVDLDNYDYVFLSFELESTKPNKEIYDKVKAKLPFKESDILFIDDREDNVETAKELGWNAIKLTGLELDKIKEVCEEFLINEN